MQDKAAQAQLAEKFDVPDDFIEYIARNLLDAPESDKVARLTDALSSCKDIQFLYLPTYRRIEQDLQSIFRKSSIDIDQLRKALSSGAEDT